MDLTRQYIVHRKLAVSDPECIVGEALHQLESVGRKHPLGDKPFISFSRSRGFLVETLQQIIVILPISASLSR